MSKRIPERLDPWRYADLGKSLSGSLRLDSLPRLAACLAASEGDADFDLRFERDGERRAVMTGTIRAALVLQCQRCLEPLAYPVQAPVAVAFVEGIEQAAQLPESLDPCLVEEGSVSFKDLVEDELLLTLPQVAMHPRGQCANRSVETPRPEPAEPDAQTRRNPFAVLAELKNDHD